MSMDCWSILGIGKYMCRSETTGNSSPSHSSIVSYPTCPTGEFSRINPIGRFVSSPCGKSLSSHQSERDEASKQFRFDWPKYWEWPPACTTEWDVCSSIASSQTEIQPTTLCVTLEAPTPVPKKFPDSTTFSATPEFITFRQDTTTGIWDEFAWIRVQNRGTVTRRINPVWPVDSDFTLVYGAALHERTAIPPGLSSRILVQFTPRSQEPIKTEILIRVEDDGGIVVPIYTEPQPPPELDLEDFFCGCTFIGNKVVNKFQIKNLRGSGRFWVLPASEFLNESFGVPPPPQEKPKVCKPAAKVSVLDEFPGEQDQVAEDMENPGTDEDLESRCDLVAEDDSENHPPPNTPVESHKIMKPGQVHVPPFRLSPAAWSVKTGQVISVKVSFTPTDSKYYHERLAILCDNGEVRWIVLKGFGMEPKRQKMISVKGDTWITDGPVHTLDFGDMSSKEPLSNKLTIFNNSTIPVYYRWVFLASTLNPLSPAELYAQTQFQNRPKERELLEDEGEEDEEVKEDLTIPGIPVTICPEEGVLAGCDDVLCMLDLTCPVSLGTFSSRLCLYVSQFTPESIRALATMSEREIWHELQRQWKAQAKHSDPFSPSTYVKYPAFEIPPIPTEPTVEISLWLRSVPLQCFFEPALLACTGNAFTQVKKRLNFFNATRHPVKLSLEGIQSESVIVTVTPTTLKVAAQTETCLKVTLRFQKPGEIHVDMTGELELPFNTVKVYLPARVTTDPPILCRDIVEPIVNPEQPVVVASDEEEDDDDSVEESISTGGRTYSTLELTEEIHSVSQHQSEFKQGKELEKYLSGLEIK